ncbi:MAG: glycosyltransferase [Clostridium sp.]|nr:glycosyltransferase [Clostridium sp.]
MNKEELIVAIHGDNKETGGRYNVLASFNNALIKGFEQAGVKAMSTKECFEKNITPNLAIALNATGLPLWQNILNNGITNIMWNTDSIFYQNYEVVEQFSQYKNFVLFNSCAEDTPAIRHYLPSLVSGYIPGGTDLDFWKKQDVEKEYDITFFGSIDDYDSRIAQLKETMPELVFKLMMDFCEVALSYPELSLWQIYQLFKKQIGLNLDTAQYLLLSKSISYIITYKQRVKMIQALKDFNLTIFGEGPWEKYISGNIKLIKGGDIRETVNLMNKSKITLHSNPFHLAGGLHDRILNASAIETMVLTGFNRTINAEFSDSIVYCDAVNYSDIAEKADYYLKHADERQEKASKASAIVKEKHKWSDRAKSILEIIE